MVDNDQTLLSSYDGIVDFTNNAGHLPVTPGQTGAFLLNQPPHLEAKAGVQWWLYYPAVLTSNELIFPEKDTRALSSSLRAYSTGDLHEALLQYPTDRNSVTQAETAYHAQLLLDVGSVESATELLT